MSEEDYRNLPASQKARYEYYPLARDQLGDWGFSDTWQITPELLTTEGTGLPAHPQYQLAQLS